MTNKTTDRDAQTYTDTHIDTRIDKNTHKNDIPVHVRTDTNHTTYRSLRYTHHTHGDLLILPVVLSCHLLLWCGTFGCIVCCVCWYVLVRATHQQMSRRHRHRQTSHVLFCPVLSCPVLSCPVLSCSVM